MNPVYNNLISILSVLSNVVLLPAGLTQIEIYALPNWRECHVLYGLYDDYYSHRVRSFSCEVFYFLDKNNNTF